jgi:hypothetical protein
MSATLLYRIAAVVLLVFAVGHTMGFMTFQPSTSDGLAVYAAMNSVHFDLSGSSRTYSELYTGFGLTVTAYLLFAAFLAWHLGSLARTQPRAIGALAWAFVAVQLIGLGLSIRYFFLLPMLFGGVVVLLLAWAALSIPKGSA